MLVGLSMTYYYCTCAAHSTFTILVVLFMNTNAAAVSLIPRVMLCVCAQLLCVAE
jgi:hypothetical protein